MLHFLDISAFKVIKSNLPSHHHWVYRSPISQKLCHLEQRMYNWLLRHVGQFQHYLKICNYRKCHKSEILIIITTTIANKAQMCVSTYLVICVKRRSRSKAKNECDKNWAPNQGKANNGGVSLSLCICNVVANKQKKQMEYSFITLIFGIPFITHHLPDAISIQQPLIQTKLRLW